MADGPAGRRYVALVVSVPWEVAWSRQLPATVLLIVGGLSTRISGVLPEVGRAGMIVPAKLGDCLWQRPLRDLRDLDGTGPLPSVMGRLCPCDGRAHLDGPAASARPCVI